METNYGIGVKNRYALFYDDEQDPADVIKAREVEREKKKQKQVQDKENKGKNTTSNQKPKQPIAAQKTTKDVPPPKTQEITPKKEAPATEINNRNRSQRVPGDQQKNKFNAVPVRERGFDRGEREPRTERRDDVRNPPQGLEERKNVRNHQETAVGNVGGSFQAAEFKDPVGGDRRFRGRGGGAVRGGTRGTGLGRGGFGRGGSDNRGKREYDRHSGSDRSSVKPFDKKDGGGAHNWGNIRDEMNDQMNTTNNAEESRDWAESVDDADNDNANKTDSPAAPANDVGNQEPKPEEPKEMTLDEWKKEQEKKRFVPQFNLRKAGEGEDVTQWKKTYQLQKKKEEENHEEVEEEEDDDDHVARGRKKMVVDIEINFADSRRGRGRGRGRGGLGDRGGRTGVPRTGDEAPAERSGRGGARTGSRAQSKQMAPRVDDEKDFPALG